MLLCNSGNVGSSTASRAVKNGRCYQRLEGACIGRQIEETRINNVRYCTHCNVITELESIGQTLSGAL